MFVIQLCVYVYMFRSQNKPLSCWLKLSTSRSCTLMFWILTWLITLTSWRKCGVWDKGFVFLETTSSSAAAASANRSSTGVCVYVCILRCMCLEFEHNQVFNRWLQQISNLYFISRLQQRTYLLDSSDLYSVLDLQQVFLVVIIWTRSVRYMSSTKISSFLF